MTVSLRLVCLLLFSLLTLNGCAKKKSPLRAERTNPPLTQPTPIPEDAKPQPSDSAPSPIPLPEPSVATSQPVTADTSGTKPPITGPIKTQPVPTPSSENPEQTTTSNSQPTKIENDPLTLFENCLHENVNVAMDGIKAKPPRKIVPGDLLAAKNFIIKFCHLKLDDQMKDLDIGRINVAKIVVLEALRLLPEYEDIIKFFNATEDNTNFSSEQKAKIYEAYGSGGEIISKNIQFFGTMEAAKTSAHVVAYAITHATGTRTTRVFTGAQDIRKTVLELKNTPKPNNRYTFDFSPNPRNTYLLTISDGSAKIVANVTFIKGDIKALREHETVTVALTVESWSRVQEEHLRRLLFTEAKELLSMPFSLERDQKDMSLVRTCNLSADGIACSDPDYTSRAIVRMSATKSP